MDVFPERVFATFQLPEKLLSHTFMKKDLR